MKSYVKAYLLIDLIDIQINLKPGTAPPWMRLIPLSDDDNTLLKDYINEELEKGYIATSESLCSSPIFFMAKADGTKRPCIDYRESQSKHYQE